MKMPGLLSAFLLPALLYAQKPAVSQKPAVRSNPYAQTDARALQLPDSSSHEVSRIAAYMTSNFTTATEKTRAIFIWIANNIQYDIDNSVQHQERIAMRNIVHDALDIDQFDTLPRCVRLGFGFVHDLQSASWLGFESRAAVFAGMPPLRTHRRRVAISLKNVFAGWAGAPTISECGGTSAMTPACAPMRDPAPIRRWPTTPACPASTT